MKEVDYLAIFRADQVARALRPLACYPVLTRREAVTHAK